MQVDSAHSQRTPAWLKWGLAALIVLRLVFVSHDEVRVEPYDSAAYIMQANAWYWGNGYNNWTYSRQPGYPLFIAVSSMLGLPLRLAIEVVWIASVLVIVRAFLRIGVKPRGGLLLATLLLFHPFATELFNFVYSDTLYTCAWIVFTIAIAMAASRRTWHEGLGWGVLAAIAGVIAANTRQETVLVYGLALVAGALVVTGDFVARKQARGEVESEVAESPPVLEGRRRLVRDRLMVAVLLPLVVSFLSVQAVNAANKARIGARVGYDWALPGFRALYQTMLSIPPEQPRLRVPIPKDVRARASEASPMFAAMREQIEHGPSCESFRQAGARTTGIADEPGSYNLWAIRESIWALWSDRIQSAADYDALCWQVVGELRAAQDRGELNRRWAPMAFIPPEWPELPVAIARSFATSWSVMTSVRFTRIEDASAVEPRVVQAFDELGLRRTALVHPSHADPPTHGVWHRAGTVKDLDAFKHALARRAWPVVCWCALVACLGGWVMALRAWWVGRSIPSGAWWMLAAVCTASLCMRTLLVCVLDATGVVASQRYLFPTAVLLVIAGVLGIRGIAMSLLRRDGTSKS